MITPPSTPLNTPISTPLHIVARTVIAALLEGEATGVRATAAAAALALAACGAPDQVIDQALQRVAIMPPDRAIAHPHPANQESIPATSEAWIEQSFTWIIDHPMALGQSLAVAQGLARAWPSATTAERALLRNRFLTGLHNHVAALGSYATRDQLRDWTRNLPTMLGNEVPNIVVFSELIQQTNATDVHRLITEHLMTANDLAVLTSMLATLSSSVVGDGRPERATLSSDAGLAAVLMAQHIHQLDPSVSATLLLQNAHQLWWSCQGRVRHQSDTFPAAMEVKAIFRSRPNQARRGGRRLSVESNWWPAVWAAIGELIADPHREWALAALFSAESRLRHSEHIPPEVAGAIAAVIAQANAATASADG